MKFKLLGLSSFALLMLSTSMVGAKMLSSSSDWVIRKIDADVPYCILSREYNEGVKFTVAKNNAGEGTIAFDYGRQALNINKTYPVVFNVGGVQRSYQVKPVSPSVMIMRLGRDASFYDAMADSNVMDLSIDNQDFSFSLSEANVDFEGFEGCLSSQPMIVDAKKVVPPKAVSTQNNQISKLIEENRRLTSMLSDAVNKSAEISIPKNDPMVGQLKQELLQSQQKNRMLLSKVEKLERDMASSNQSINPDLSSLLAEKNKQIELLNSQNNQLKENLAAVKERSPQMIAEAVANKQPSNDPVLIQQNESMKSVISNLEKQIGALESDNVALSKRASTRQRGEVVIKEVPVVREVEVVKQIIKEVPVYADGTNSDNAGVAMQLAEAETQAKTYQAERDEYRRLLQTERRRLREGVDLAGKINKTMASQGNLVNDVRRLEKEKAELVRQLEYAKKTGQVVEVASQKDENSSKLNELSLQLSDAKNKLAATEAGKQKLEKRMAMIDSESVMIQRQLAEAKIAKLADDRPEIIQEEIEAKTLRSEVAALRAQNNMLKADIGVEKQKIEQIQKPSEPINVVASAPTEINDNSGRVSRPLDRATRTQSLRNRLQQVENVKSVLPSVMPTSPIQIARAPVQQVIQQHTSIPSAPQMVALSGDEIRQLVAQSKIPLQSSVDRIDRISGPDFAAFRWDTGFVYGSAEQSRLSDVSAFNNSVQHYIQKTASRCEGSFDQNVQAIDTSNGLTAKSADIACVDDNAVGSAASILFFVRDGMFYALAHEANMDSFKVAMDMRDRLVGSIDQIF